MCSTASDTEEKKQKKFKKPLTRGARIDIIAERLEWRTAMKREIAVKTGNFRGVCPTGFGRLREPGSRRISSWHGDSRLIMPAFFMSRSDTHGNVDRKTPHRYEARTPKRELKRIATDGPEGRRKTEGRQRRPVLSRSRREAGAGMRQKRA